MNDRMMQEWANDLYLRAVSPGSVTTKEELPSVESVVSAIRMLATVIKNEAVMKEREECARIVRFWITYLRGTSIAPVDLRRGTFQQTLEEIASAIMNKDAL